MLKVVSHRQGILGTSQNLISQKTNLFILQLEIVMLLESGQYTIAKGHIHYRERRVGIKGQQNGWIHWENGAKSQHHRPLIYGIAGK